MTAPLADATHLVIIPSYNSGSLLLETVRDVIDRWRRAWRYIKMPDANREPGSGEPTNVGTDIELGSLSTARKLTLELIEQRVPNAKTTTRETPDWGPFWLLRKYRDRNMSSKDPSTWYVVWPMQAGSQEAISLKLKFDRPVPDPDEWPAE